MINWDGTGLKGVWDQYEISIIPSGEGWAAIIWVNKTHLATLPVVPSKLEAHEAAEVHLLQLDKMTLRLLDRIAYDEPVEEYYDEDEDVFDSSESED